MCLENIMATHSVEIWAFWPEKAKPCCSHVKKHGNGNHNRMTVTKATSDSCVQGQSPQWNSFQNIFIFSTVQIHARPSCLCHIISCSCITLEVGVLLAHTECHCVASRSRSQGSRLKCWSVVTLSSRADGEEVLFLSGPLMEHRNTLLFSSTLFWTVTHWVQKSTWSWGGRYRLTFV